MANSLNPLPLDEPIEGSRRLSLALRVAWMRLRFIVAVAALFAVIFLWRQLGGYWDQAVGWVAGSPAHEAGVSPDTEYFCPMCPGVLSAWPEKCPVCKMPLVCRAIGEAQVLPEGVTGRMQISPYRLQLGGIQTSAIGYRPLMHEIRAAGRLTRDDQGWLATGPLNPWDAPLVAVGMPAEVVFATAPAELRLTGKVAAAASSPAAGQAPELLVRIDGTSDLLTAGMSCQMAIRVPVATVEPFLSQPRDPPPLREADPRQYFVCPNHSSWIRVQAGTCPFDGLELESRTLRGDQRLQWTCLLHDSERFTQRGHDCPHCQRGCQTPRVVDFAPRGEVLAVPESAVIDNGRTRIVFVETMPGMFDGVAVRLGAKQGGYYPVLAGLAPGARVATSGAFLLDAETRLNPALAASYFGAGSAAGTGAAGPLASGAATENQPPVDLLAGLLLSPEDRILAGRQAVCPITRLALGSMGELVRVEVEGQPVFLCCEGCRGKIRQASLSASPPPETPAGPQP